VDDPYRFLEDTGNPEIQKFMRAQADAAAAVLDRIPARGATVMVGLIPYQDGSGGRFHSLSSASPG